MKNNQKIWLKIGVLGGMGPIATMEIYRRILHVCQTQYACVQDYQFPQIIINSVPLDGFTEKGIEDLETVKERMILEAKSIENLVDFFIVPCNTLHLFHQEMSTQINVEWISLTDAVMCSLDFGNDAPMGLLTSDSTKESGLYTNKFTYEGVAFIETNRSQQNILNQIIEKVMTCKNTIHDNYALHKIMMEMKNAGAKSILLGCTELPIAYQTNFSGLNVYDSLDVLVKATLDHAYKG